MLKSTKHKKWRTRADPYDILPHRSQLYDESDKKYRLEIGEGVQFLRGRKERLGRNFNLAKTAVIGVSVTVLSILLIGRAFWLQVSQGDYYRQLADGNRLRIKKVEAKRGVIYDRYYQPLVHNVANFVLYFVPADLPTDDSQRQNILTSLSDIIGSELISPAASELKNIQPLSYQAYQPLFVADNIDYDKAMRIYLATATMPGVFLDAKSRRSYDLPNRSLSHLIGYTGKVNVNDLAANGGEYSSLDYIGKIGLEQTWESELRGLFGTEQVEVDALGKSERVISQTPVTDGNNLLLSLDSTAQAKLEEYLTAELKKDKLTKGAAIVLDPNNGEIIALVSWPSFDNNLFAAGISTADYQALTASPDQPLFNRAVSGEYPPGSTIKPVVAAAALDAGIVDANKKFLSAGGLRVGAWFFPDWKVGGHGWINIEEALANSVNTYFYYVGGGFGDFQGLGVDKLVNYFKIFHLGQPTGIDLPNEADGFLPSRQWKQDTKKEAWYIGDTYHIAIGQGDLLVTPLQVADYTAYFANGGRMVTPHLVKAVLDAKDQVIRKVEPTDTASNVVSADSVATVRAGMRLAVTNGSAKRLNSLSVTAAGKTGTAQWAIDKPPHAWFTAFAPYDQPRVVVTVLIEQGVEGSSTAIVVADNFLRWYFSQNQANP